MELTPGFPLFRDVSWAHGRYALWASPGLTFCNWHSVLRLSWTTALQQLPDADHGGRMKSQIKGSEPVFNFSAILKKREAFRPFTSAQASSDTDTVGETGQTHDVSGTWNEQRSPVFRQNLTRCRASDRRALRDGAPNAPHFVQVISDTGPTLEFFRKPGL